MTLQLAALLLWLLPPLVAWCRYVRLRTRVGIALVTLLLSWTVIGWVAAMLWALEAKKENVDARY